MTTLCTLSNATYHVTNEMGSRIICICILYPSKCRCVLPVCSDLFVTTCTATVHYKYIHPSGIFPVLLHYNLELKWVFIWLLIGFSFCDTTKQATWRPKSSSHRSETKLWRNIDQDWVIQISQTMIIQWSTIK